MHPKKVERFNMNDAKVMSLHLQPQAKLSRKAAKDDANSQLNEGCTIRFNLCFFYVALIATRPNVARTLEAIKSNMRYLKRTRSKCLCHG